MSDDQPTEPMIAEAVGAPPVFTDQLFQSDFEARYVQPFEPKPVLEPAQRQVANPTGKLMAVDETGHSELTWDERDPESVKEAKAKFDNLVKNKRYLAFKMNADGTKGEQMREFDPSIQDIVLIPQMQGG